jgi:hypothetical protein
MLLYISVLIILSVQAVSRSQIEELRSRYEYRTPNFELRSFIKILVSFDIHHSLFDILRFTTSQEKGSASSALAK